MKIKKMSVNDIIPYENNPRDNTDAVPVVAKSIKEFGFKVPIVIDKNGIIVTGHTRLKAAISLGMAEVPVIVADDLTDEQIKAFRLVDNKTQEFALWDDDKLAKELEDLEMDLSVFDFDYEGLLEDEIDEEDGDVEGVIRFTEELGEESNYIVLKFDRSVDWVRLESLFDLPRVHALDSKEGFERKGVGRVVDGNQFIDAILKNGGGGGVIE